MAITILRLPTVKSRTGLSRSSIYRFISKGLFPKPIYIGERAVGWNDLEIEEWLASKIEKSRRTKR
jgi:prophage regulatory protein